MKNTKQKAVYFLLVAAFIYMLVAFVEIRLNFYLWSSESRFIFALIMGVIGFIYLIDNSNNNERK